MKTTTILSRGLLLLVLVTGLAVSYYLFFVRGVAQKNMVKGFSESLIHFDTTGKGQSLNTDTSFLRLDPGGNLGIIVVSDQIRPYDTNGEPVRFQELLSMNRSQLEIRAIDKDSIHIEQGGVLVWKGRLTTDSHLRISQEPLGTDPHVRLSICENCKPIDPGASPLVSNDQP